MALLKLQGPALKHDIDEEAKNGYVKTIGACTEAGYRPDRQTNGNVKTIGACTEAGYRPAGRQMAMLNL